MTADPPNVRIVQAKWPQDRALAAGLLQEYFASLEEDIGFQNPSDELASLPGAYAPPGGALFLARASAEALAIGAYRSHRADLCEMKRLYVRPAARGTGLGGRIAGALIATARAQGYRTMLLDTLASMERARTLYRSLGFRPVAPYYDNPLPGVAFMALTL